ncbi:MAG TPA: T9SS type A sorting domain-containing protein [Flavobacteriales bacterium]|nr:T9SS type A sorting domain-containing protein [Flavobacteriales bacterium]HRO38965.1 T9SS type A sorting domain-containing protein [Flavobacteriales bacterium]HRQ85177.1 T9SS type A sorting domain-containing protein [Flavobacteriales bacterium]
MKARLLLASLAAGTMLAPASAQIPNGGFEQWVTPTGATYQDPVGWITFNGLTSLFPGMGLSCEMGSPGAVGSHYATVTTREATGVGVIPGAIAVGDGVTGRTGFAYTNRPATFTGQWQYNIQPNDSGIVSVVLMKWNPGTQESTVVGGAVLLLQGSISGWQPINATLQYETAETPDSAFVTVISSVGSVPVTGSFIKVDALALSGVFTGVGEQDGAQARIFPTLASDQLNVEVQAPLHAVAVIDLTGRAVMFKPAGGLSTKLDVSGLKPGRYMVQVELTDGKRVVRSFVKQ